MTSCHRPASEFEDWTSKVCALYGLGTDVDPIRTTEAVLDAVRDVGRLAGRPAGPLAVFVLGVAAGRAVPAGSDVGDEVERLARGLLELAQREAGTAAGGTP